jgi:hypothetical protein
MTTPPHAKNAGEAVGEFFGEVLRGARFLANYALEPSFASKPARELSPQEAFDLVMHLAFHGEIVLDERVKVDGGGKIVFPRPGQQIRVRTTMAGVDYYHASGKFNANSGSAGAMKDTHFAPTPAFAVVLYRLAKLLRQGWGASQIVWGGVGSGANDKSKNCHDVGTCVDFYGATTTKGKFDVVADWTRKPVYREDGKELPITWDQGTWGVASFENRWGPANQTRYRLRPQNDSPAYDFFLAVYKLVNEQCTSAGDTAPAAFGMGQLLGRGPTIHPDYPDPTLRRNHRDHMHFQLGPAFL